jgi:hypothetical protein
MVPSSAELTWPVNAALGALAARTKLLAVQKTIITAIVIANVINVFFIVEILRKI